MIFQGSLFDYVFQVLVLGQPLFWMWLYGTDIIRIRERFKSSFFIVSALVFILVYNTKASIGFYTTTLLLQYISLTMLSVHMFNQRYNIKQALSLGFLTVFLNSYYWEIPLHLAEILSGDLHVGMLVQLWRLVPLLFFLKHFEFSAYDRWLLSLGLGFSAVVMFLKLYSRLPYGWVYLYPVNRFVCLCLLLKVLIEAKHIDKNL
jgi:hypothetical protein